MVDVTRFELVASSVSALIQLCLDDPAWIYIREFGPAGAFVNPSKYCHNPSNTPLLKLANREFKVLALFNEGDRPYLEDAAWSIAFTNTSGCST